MITMTQQVPANVVRLGLRMARLPISVAGRALAHGREEEWPASMAFDGLAGAVKEKAGGVLRDDGLAEEGRLERTRVARLRDAVEHEVAAERVRDDAREHVQSARAEAEQEVREATAQERAQRTAVQAEAAARAERVEAHTEAQREAVETETAQREQAVEREARQGRATAAKATRKAVSEERRALAAEAKAQAADEAVERLRTRRRTTG